MLSMYTFFSGALDTFGKFHRCTPKTEKQVIKIMWNLKFNHYDNDEFPKETLLCIRL